MYGKTILILCLFNSWLVAETAPFDPFAGNTIIRDNPSGQDLANDVTNRTVHSANEVVEDPNVQTNGREYKAANADKQGQTGTGMAIATGSALMAQGVPMSMSIIPSVAAAGRILIAKAALEFAQAGADAQSSAKNKAQNKLLTNKAEDSPGSQSTTDAIKKALNNPELDKLLSERGVSSEDFKDRMAKGEFQDPESVGRALGDTNSYTAEDLAAAEGLASSTLNDTFAQVHGEASSKSVGVNEALPANSSNPEGKDGGAGYSVASSNDGRSGDLVTGSVSETSVPGSFANAKNHGGLGTGSNEKSLTEAGFDPKALLSKIFGKDALAAMEKKMPGFLRNALEKMGIMIPSSKQHIFQTAHRNFRSFGKWRRSIRVAMAPNALR